MWRNSAWWAIQNTPIAAEAEREPADLRDGVPELLAGLDVGDVGHPQVNDQQGDRDSEDGVAEEQDPVVLELPGPGQNTPALGRGCHGRECTRPAGKPQAPPSCCLRMAISTPTRSNSCG